MEGLKKKHRSAHAIAADLVGRAWALGRRPQHHVPPIWRSANSPNPQQSTISLPPIEIAQASRKIVRHAFSDCVVGGLLLLYGLLFFTDNYREHTKFDFVLLFVTVAAISVRRVFPELVLTICLLITITQHVTHTQESYAMWALSISLFTIAAVRPIVRGMCAALCTLFTLIYTTGFQQIDAAWMGSTLAFFGASAVAGLAMRRLSRLNNDLQVAGIKLAAAAQQRERIAIMEERSRLRDDLHDIVGHHINVAAVLADTASIAHGQDSERVEHSLEGIRAACRGALDQMDRATEWLDSQPDLDPTPSLSDLHKLLDRMKLAGLTIDEQITPTTSELNHLDHVISATAYRFLREALTNVLKHSNRAWCRVAVTAQPEQLRIAVTSESTATPAPMSNRGGLRRLRQRIELIDGRLTVDTTGNRFVQTAQFPIGKM